MCSSDLAVSQHTGDTQHWATAATVAARLVAELGPEPVGLNVNVPNVDLDGVAGTRWTTLSDRIPYRLNGPRLEVVEPGRHRVHFTRDGDYDRAPGTDTEAVESGFVSITRLRPTGAW